MKCAVKFHIKRAISPFNNDETIEKLGKLKMKRKHIIKIAFEPKINPIIKYKIRITK